MAADRDRQLSEPQAVIAAEAALRIAAAAVEHARQIGARVNVAVVDAAGLPAAFVRMPGAALHSIDIARDKAYTAASFGLATSAWHAALQAEPPAVRDGLVRRPRFVAFAGGLPIVAQGTRIGGVGVSGGTAEQDEAIANAGLTAVGLGASAGSEK